MPEPTPVAAQTQNRLEVRVYEAEELRPTSEGPNVGVEYSYSEAHGSTKESQPLVLKNISNKDAAHNVRVLPLAVGELTSTFLPDIVPFIEPLGKKEVKPFIEGVFPTLRHDFPVLFRRSYRDSGTEELFGEHPYTLRIEYENAASTKVFETTVVLLYKPWKTEIRVGETRRRVKKLI